MISLLVSRAFSLQEIITTSSPFIFPMSLEIVYVFVLLSESLNIKSTSLPTQKDSYSFDHPSHLFAFSLFYFRDGGITAVCRTGCIYLLHIYNTVSGFLFPFIPFLTTANSLRLFDYHWTLTRHLKRIIHKHTTFFFLHHVAYSKSKNCIYLLELHFILQIHHFSFIYFEVHLQFHYSFTISRFSPLTTLRLLSPSCCLSISPFSVA